jgi:glutathione S-transferase
MEIVMSEFVIHTIPGSPFGRSVLIALEEKGADYRLAPRANLAAWLERMEARPSLKATTWDKVAERAKAA